MAAEAPSSWPTIADEMLNDYEKVRVANPRHITLHPNCRPSLLHLAHKTEENWLVSQIYESMATCSFLLALSTHN